MRSKLILHVLMLVSMVGMFAPRGSAPVLAQDDPSAGTPPSISEIKFVARPDSGADGDPFVAEVTPGNSHAFNLVVANESTFDMGLSVYTANTGAAPNGGLALALPEQELVPPASWLEFSAFEANLAPGDSQTSTFGVNVPADTPPGEYVAAIAVETVDAYAIEGNSLLQQKVRKVLPVYILVPGDYVSSFELGEPFAEATHNSVRIRVPITNTGNTRVLLSGTLSIHDLNDTEMLVAEVRMRAVYGGQSTVVEVTIPSGAPAGDYTLSLQLKDELSEATGSLDKAPLTIPDVVAPSAVEIVAVTLEPNGEPLQFVNVGVTMNNAGAAIPSARLTLHTFRDGEKVEDFVLANSLAVPEGQSTVEQRYIPATGFESGTWRFDLTLESVDAATGLVTPIFTQEDVATLEVP